jgi:hypothetical protein
MSGVRKPSALWRRRHGWIDDAWQLDVRSACQASVLHMSGEFRFHAVLGTLHVRGAAGTIEAAQLAAEDALEQLLTQALSELHAGRDPLDSPAPPARKAPTEGPP